VATGALAGLAEAKRVKELLRSGQFDQALAAAQRMTEQQPDAALAWYSLGDVLMVARHPKEAIPALEKANALNPKLGLAFFDLGGCLAELGRFDAAIAALSRGVEQMPDFLPAWSLLYRCYVTKHDPMGAENSFRAYVSAHPTCAYAWYTLGEVQMFEQLHASAISSLQKAADLKPDFTESLKALGLAYAQNQQPDQAIDCFARAAGIRPDAEALNNLGYEYFTLGQTDKAIEILQEAMKVDPKYEKAVYNLTAAYAKEQEWVLARQTCQALAQLNPRSAAELSKNFPASGTIPPSNLAPLPALAGAQASSPASTPPSIPTASVTSLPAAPTGSGAGTEQAAAAVPSLTSGGSSEPSADPVTKVAPPTPAPTAPPISPAPAAPKPTVTYAVALPQSWIKPLDPDAVPLATTTDVEGGVDYVLVDDQELMDPREMLSDLPGRGGILFHSPGGKGNRNAGGPGAIRGARWLVDLDLDRTGGGNPHDGEERLAGSPGHFQSAQVADADAAGDGAL
jgi:tetratricopeptide (TPR) repeat protein